MVMTKEAKFIRNLEKRSELEILKDFGKLFSFLLLFSFSCSAKREPEFPKASEDLMESRDFEKSPEEGSLFYEGSPLANLYADMKARRVGDVLVVKIVENVKAKNQQTKDMSRNSEMKYNISAGITKSKLDGFSLDAGAGGKNNFSSKGSQNSENQFIATVGARVIKVFPSGNLLIEGEKYIRHNDEVQKIYVRGIVRPEDIMHDNSVLSTSLVNARIEYVSEGDFAKKLRQGWLQKILDFISPF